MKFISWNVNGLRACAGKGFADAFAALDADFFCLQETKMQEGQLDLSFPGYQSYWNYAEKKGFSGTTTRDASSQWRWSSSFWCAATRLTHKTDCADWIIA